MDIFRNKQALDALKMFGKPFRPLQVDLNNMQSIQRSVSETVEHLGGLDIVVNNANDLKPLSVHVTNVLSGWFRTNFAKADSIAYGLSGIEDYAHLQDSFKKMESMDGKQPGDPDKMAAVFLELVASSQPPVNLFLGSDAFARAKAKIEQLAVEMDKWNTISASTDFSTN